MSSRSRSNVFQTLNVERLTCDYLHLNQTPIRVNGYPFGTADLANTANFITAESLQQSDWLTVNPNSATFIRNKPNLANVALSGKFTDLSDAPSLVPVNADWTQQDQTQLSFINNKPTVSKAGSSGLYSDLVADSGQPVVPTSVDYNAASSTATTLAIANKPPPPIQPVNADWAVTTASSLAFIRNKPSLSAVALSGSFADLASKPVVYQTVDWAASGNSGTTLAIANRPEIPPAPVNADWTAPSGPAAILNRPTIPDSQVNSDWAATTGPAAILSKPRIPNPQINSDWLATQGSVAYIANRPQLGKVAISDDYNELKNLPPIPPPQQPSDWNSVFGPTFIQNKPVYAAVATSGKYSDILANSGQPVLPNAVDWNLTNSTSSTLAVKNRPSIPAPQVQSDWNQKDNLQISFIANKPVLAAVALSGNYNDLSNKPTTSSGLTQADWTQQDSTQGSYIVNKPFLKTVATTGRYSDLVANSGQPQSVTSADWNATTASGGVVPVTNKPSIPAAQINADWNSTSGLSQIYNQPMLSAVALSNKYNDLDSRPALGLVATSNLYSDLTNAPLQADYNLLASTTTSLAVINKPTALSAFSNDAGYYKANDSPMFGSVFASAGISSGGNLSAVDGVFSGNLAATLLTLSGGAQVAFLNIPGSQVVNLGSDQPKAANAGMLGYQTTTAGAVDIYGAGTAVGSRGIKLWDNVVVPGNLNVGGGASTGALTAASVKTTGATTLSGGATVSGNNLVVNTALSVTGTASTGALTATALSTRGNLSVTGTASTGALTATSINTAGAASTGALTATSVSTGGNLSVTGTASTGALTSSSISTTGTASTGALTASGVVTANTGINLPGTKALNFGSDVTKETNAGRIGYGSLTAGVLDVVGGGTAAGSRAVKVWDNLTIPGTCSVGGTLTVTGTASTGPLVSSSISTPALTVAGASVFAQVNADWNATSGVAQILNKPSSVGGGGGGAPIYMPALAAFSGGGYTVTASSNYDTSGSYVAWKAFDAPTLTYWISAYQTYAQGPGTGLYTGSVTTGGIRGEYLQVQTPSPYQLQSYRLFGVNSHALSDFTIMGSSDLGTWTTIDTRTSQNCTTEQAFDAPAQTTTFTYFRLIITRDANTESTSWTIVSNFAPVFTSGSGGGTVNADWNATSGSAQILNKPTKLTQFTNDLAGASGGWNLTGSNVLNFGSDVTKETNAGRIGYQLTTPGALDVYGGGTAVGSRTLKLWDNVNVPGTLAVTGTASAGVLTASSVTTPALTVAGSPVSAQVTADWNATSGVAQILNKPSSVGGGGGGAGITMPYLTSSTGSGYTVVASSVFNSSLTASNAFDASTTSAWFSNSGTYDGVGGYTGSVNTGGVSGEYIQIQTPSALQLQSYRLYGSTTHYLSSFSIMASNNLNTWTIIDTKTNQDCRTEQSYTAPAQTAYFGYFRLIVTQDQTTQTGSTFTVVTNFAPVFTSGGTGNADWNATSGSAQILNKPTKLTQFTNDLAGASGGWSLTGSNVLNFGSDVTKETNAGRIGYQTFDVGCLNIVGAGTSTGSRTTKFYDNVIVNNNLTLFGTITSSRYTPWTNVSYQNGFGTLSGFIGVQYSRDELGYLMLRGMMSCPTTYGPGSAHSIAFVLPFLPYGNSGQNPYTILPVCASDGAGEIRIDGNKYVLPWVVPQVGSGSNWISFDGMRLPLS